MSKLRWAKWFWADWANDTALNLCSIPARGLWMALLCLAAQGEPYGTVTIKERVPTDDELFDLTCPRSTRRRDFNRWLVELEAHGVLQRDHRSAIWSPRISHSGAISLAWVDAAHARWQAKENKRNAQNLHEQASGNGVDLHEQNEISDTINSNIQTHNTELPPDPPPGGGARAAGKNGGGKEPRNAWDAKAAAIIAEREREDDVVVPLQIVRP